LGRGFFYAGARSLLATHWSVESESARDLMTQTFENYGADDNTSKAQALRAAQLKMASGKFGHPFYWSAYTLVGDGGR
jgi:CHAT domain-containing protein